MITIHGWWQDGVPTRIVVEWQRPATIGGEPVPGNAKITYEIRHFDHRPSQSEKADDQMGVHVPPKVDEYVIDSAELGLDLTDWLYFGYRASMKVQGTDYVDPWWWSDGDPDAAFPGA